MRGRDEEPIGDQVSLIGLEADVYEAVATLEYLGRPVTASQITSATGAASLDQDAVLAALESLSDRGMLVVAERDREPVYEPAFRGWSAAPRRRTGRGLLNSSGEAAIITGVDVVIRASLAV